MLRAATWAVARGDASARATIAAARWLLLDHGGRRSLGTADIAVLVAHPGDARVLLDARLPGEPLVPAAVLKAGRRPQHHRIVRDVFAASGSPADRSEALHRVVTDAATSDDELTLALCLIESHAREMAPAHRGAVLQRVIQLGAPPVDPYAPAAASEHARWAAAALLVADPTLDEVVLSRLRTSELDRDGLLLIYAGALVQRDRSWHRLADAIEAASLTPEEGLRFAATCDQRATTLEPIYVHPYWRTRIQTGLKATGARLRWSGLWAAPLSGALAALAYGICVTFVVVRTTKVPSGYALGPGDALAALSLLVAAIVFAAELAADRLHGLMARRVALSPALASALMFEVLLLISAGWRVAPADTDNRAFLQALLIAGLVASLSIALIGLLRRTDMLRAIELYARRRRRVFDKAGKRHGAVQAGAITVRAEISGFGWAKLSATRAHSERRAIVVGPRRGFVVVDLGTLAKMDRDSAWRSQNLRLRVTAVLGEIVARGEEIASVVPDVGASIKPHDLAVASTAVTTRSVGAVAEAMEAVGALVASIASLAAAGNVEAAERTTDRLLDLVRISLEASRSGRPTPKTDDYLPFSPLARVAVDRALAAIRDNDDSSVLEAMLELLDALASLGEEHEGLAALVLARFTEDFGPGEQPGLHTNVLWHCAHRAVDADDRRTIVAIFQRLEDLLSQEDPAAPERAIQLGGWVGAYAVWTRPRLAREAFEWLSGQPPATPLRRVALQRLGTAAMLAGNQSLAVRIAYSLSGEGAAMRTYATPHATGAYEQHQSELYGLPLGDDPQWALLEFADLAIRLAPAPAVSTS